MDANANPGSITQKIVNAVTRELSELVDAVINETRDVTGDDSHAENYCIAIEPGYERLALELRNSLKGHSYRFNFKRAEEGYLFTIYGDLKRWLEKLEAEHSPLFNMIEFDKREFA